MKIIVIDNYDSFTYNLVHALKKITGQAIDVVRNDELQLSDLEAYDKILLSPGPGIPEEAGLLLPIIRQFAPSKSIFGVCLGHQAIGEAFGARLHNMNRVLHGIATPVTLTGAKTPLFADMPETFDAGRYHSWIVEQNSLPDCLAVTCVDEENRIMALQHRDYRVYGVQFHPESVLTPLGEKIIENWLYKL